MCCRSSPMAACCSCCSRRSSSPVWRCRLGFNATLPFLNDLLGGRQTARTIHFVAMSLLVGFFVIHMLMILAAGPINELRSIITGWYRTDPVILRTRRYHNV